MYHTKLYHKSVYVITLYKTLLSIYLINAAVREKREGEGERRRKSKRREMRHGEAERGERRVWACEGVERGGSEGVR